ncbi:MAG: 16S rRNA (adenine(1518)-N(6)/adenine(1519)-N(6))-dimethyltransferase RsmA [Oscillospiraceae bacterium]|nr:16S rRNA (adenine(1518)-N(6)/adenine(1519)-N(6))-dimethyltransferase RsmA [Oscillospiraceae bacterium]
MDDPRQALRAHGFIKKHSLGQHFLSDPALLARLVDAAGVTPQDDVLEIGPGSGALTLALAARARRVVAVEIDRALMPVLQQTLAPWANTQVVWGDIRRVDLEALMAGYFGGRCKVVANLPYYITTEVLQRLLLYRLPVDTLAVMVQREVGQKMLAEPGGDGYGPLAVYCRYFALTRQALAVPAACFSPPPKVDSVFMRLDMLQAPPLPCADEALFLRVVRAAFAMRRKTLANNLRAAFALDKVQATLCAQAAGVDPGVRGEALDIPAFIRVADVLAKKISQPGRNKRIDSE